MNELIIKPTDKTTIEKQVRVYMNAFEHNEEQYDVIYSKWEKKHFKNPNGESYIFGAFDDGELVGINCFLQMKYIYQNDEINVLQSCESGVLKSHQRQGIWGKIMTFAEEYLIKNTDIDVIIGFPNYKNSYPGFIKMGWKSLFNERNLILVNNGNKVMEMFSGKHWWTRIGHIFELQRLRIVLRNTDEYSVSRANTIRRKREKEDMISLQYDCRWMEWKQNYAGIDIYEIKRKEKTVAYVITEDGRMNESRYIKILKFSVIGNLKIREAALAAFLKFIRKQDYCLVRVWNDEEIYIKLGFIEMKSHVNPFIINVLNEQKMYLENGKLWNVGFLDLD